MYCLIVLFSKNIIYKNLKFIRFILPTQHPTNSHFKIFNLIGQFWWLFLLPSWEWSTTSIHKLYLLNTSSLPFYFFAWIKIILIILLSTSVIISYVLDIINLLTHIVNSRCNILTKVFRRSENAFTYLAKQGLLCLKIKIVT